MARRHEPREEFRRRNKKEDRKKSGEISSGIHLNIDRKLHLDIFDNLTTVINIHDFDPKKPFGYQELNVLSKGLKFIPTRPKIVWSQVFEYFEVFQRNLQLKFFF